MIGMRKAYILMYMGKPIVVSDDGDRLHMQALTEAKLVPNRTHRDLSWNIDRTRLFRSDGEGHAQFTGYEVREVVKA